MNGTRNLPLIISIIPQLYLLWIFVERENDLTLTSQNIYLYIFASTVNEKNVTLNYISRQWLCRLPLFSTSWFCTRIRIRIHKPAKENTMKCNDCSCFHLNSTFTKLIQKFIFSNLWGTTYHFSSEEFITLQSRMAEFGNILRGWYWGWWCCLVGLFSFLFMLVIITHRRISLWFWSLKPQILSYYFIICRFN